jgi:hypothetical protein
VTTILDGFDGKTLSTSYPQGVSVRVVINGVDHDGFIEGVWKPGSYVVNIAGHVRTFEHAQLIPLCRWCEQPENAPRHDFSDANHVAAKHEFDPRPGHRGRASR